METETPSLTSDAPSRPSSSGEEGPTFAAPSESRTMRFTSLRARFLRISDAPAETPPKIAVAPRASTVRSFSTIAALFASEAVCAPASTSMRSSNTTTET